MEYPTFLEAAIACAKQALIEFGWSKSEVKKNRARVLEIMKENSLPENNLSRVFSEMNGFRKAKD